MPLPQQLGPEPPPPRLCGRGFSRGGLCCFRRSGLPLPPQRLCRFRRSALCRFRGSLLRSGHCGLRRFLVGLLLLLLLRLLHRLLCSSNACGCGGCLRRLLRSSNVCSCGGCLRCPNSCRRRRPL